MPRHLYDSWIMNNFSLVSLVWSFIIKASLNLMYYILLLSLSLVNERHSHLSPLIAMWWPFSVQVELWPVFFIFRKCVFFFFQYVQCNLWLCSLSFATWQHGSIMIIIIFIWVEFVAHTVFFVNMWAERRTMNGNCTAWNDFTVYSTELLNWLSFLWQNSCSHRQRIEARWKITLAKTKQLLHWNYMMLFLKV